MGYSHFSIEERIAIKHLLAQGVSIRRIADELHRSASSVSREIRRNSGEPNDHGESYTVRRAERKHRERVLPRIFCMITTVPTVWMQSRA